MKKLALHPTYQLYEQKGKPFCSSLQVAESFEKRHDHVLRDIQNLDCPKDFWLPNFGETKMGDKNGRINKCFMMTKDGFTFLVMGYRGKKAAVFKIAYIRRFNEMEAQIAERDASKDEFRPFTDAIAFSHGEPKSYHYSNECNMINKLILGQTAKQFKESRGLVDVESIRPYLTSIQAADIRALQMADIGLLASGVEFQERKRALAEYHGRRKVVRLSA
jgi:Rha family phage regulatory protein